MPAPAAPATRPPEASPTAATSAAEKPSAAALMGKLEGPTIITDPARFPKTFGESPLLANQVQAGKLPALKDRLPIPEDVHVIQPLRAIGTYGGIWKRGFIGPVDTPNGFRVAGQDHVLFYDYLASTVVPALAKSWKVSDDGKVTTITLRKGLKWSDGQPFTADDFLFWYEDIYLNKDLTPAPNAKFAINGEQGVMSKVDDVTVQYTFKSPYFMFPEFLAASSGFGSMASNGGGYAPAHYLKQFHAKYAGQDKVNQMAKDAKLDNWVTLFNQKFSWTANADLPAMTPWKTTTPINTPVWTLERNPFYWEVDSAGNQLPYIDKIVYSLCASTEIVNLRAMAGDWDWQERHLDVFRVPTFLDNQQKGGYKLYLDPPGSGSEAGIPINMDYDKDPELQKWFHNIDFRHALSMGIDRHQINEAFFLGIGREGSPIPNSTNPYYPGDEYVTRWHTFDPKQANALLDKIGLDKKDADGFRLRTDGKGRLSPELTVNSAWLIDHAHIGEMVVNHWQKNLGIDAKLQVQDQSLIAKRFQANDTQMYMTTNLGTDRLFTWPGTAFPNGPGDYNGPLSGLWFSSEGKQGKAPPPEIQQVMDNWKKGRSVPAAEQVKLGQEIWKIIVEQCWHFGVVGVVPAVLGVRVVKNNLENVPGRVVVGVDSNNPGDIYPETLFFK
jgi:peptide/nickel transport system substrate-binding protein